MNRGNLTNNKEDIEALVRMVKDGDHQAFAKLYDILVDPIYRYVFYRVNDADAEDIVEQVFLKVWQYIGRYKQHKGKFFSAWVFRIAHNLIVDYYRSSKERGHSELTEMLPDTSRNHSPISRTESEFNNMHLKKALSKIKKAYQDVLIYKFINDLSNAEISEILGKSEGSIRIIQFRALSALKSELKHMGIRYEFL